MGRTGYILPYFSSIFIIVFCHFSAQFSFLYSAIFLLNFLSYILEFLATLHNFFATKNKAPSGFDITPQETKKEQTNKSAPEKIEPKKF